MCDINCSGGCVNCAPEEHGRKWAYLWVVDWNHTNPPTASADLFFSSKEKFYELLPWYKNEQLIKVHVPKDFNDWDYVPDNY